VLESGRLKRSTLTGSWLGGPVALRVGERREKGQRVLAIQAQGTLAAQRLATLANATGTVEGNTDWTGELAYVQGDHAQEPRWRMRADSNLLGVVSSLPEPFTKQSAAAAVPLHLEVAGANDAAQLHANLGDRVRSLFALGRRPDLGWVVDRGAVRFGTTAPTLPSEPVVLVRGRVSQLDLPAYAVAWTRLRRDSLPTIRAQLTADEMLVAGRRYAAVSLQAERTGAGTDLLIDSATVAGMARWPTPPGATQGRGTASGVQPAELHLSRLDLPDGTLTGEGVGLIAALAPSTTLSVDELNWRGRSLGRLTASVSAEEKLVVMDDVRLVNGTQDAHGVLRCQMAVPMCRLSFVVDSSDAGATLADFGFKPDVAANAASLKGDVEWRPTADWVGSLRGPLVMRLTDGSLHGSRRGEGRDVADAHAVDARAADAHPDPLSSVCCSLPAAKLSPLKGASRWSSAIRATSTRPRSTIRSTTSQLLASCWKERASRLSRPGAISTIWKCAGRSAISRRRRAMPMWRSCSMPATAWRLTAPII